MSFFAQMLVNGILTGGIYALMALGIVIIYKSSSVFNFAHGPIVALSAFVLWQLTVDWDLPIWFSIPMILLYIGLFSYLVQRLMLQPLTGQSIMTTIMATIALGEVISGVVILFWPGPGRRLPDLIPKAQYQFSGINISAESLISFLICGLCFWIFYLFFQKTKIGLAMRGTAEDHMLAQSEGIRVNFIFVVSWLVAVVIAAIGGTLMSSLYGVSYDSLNALGMKALAVVILGGLESVTGALVGGLVIGVVESMANGYMDPIVGGGAGEIAPYFALLLALLIRPYGFFGHRRIERV